MFHKSAILPILSLILIAPLGALGGSDKDKDLQQQQMKQTLDDMKTQVTLLEQQVRTLQQNLDRNSGQTSTLIMQMGDNVSAIRQSMGRVAEGADSAMSSVNGLTVKLAATNDKVDAISNQVAELKKMIQDLPRKPSTPTITPGDPAQLFSAAVHDSFNKNYDLAISEFQEFITTFPDSSNVSHAQYLLADCYYNKGDFEKAVDEYGRVLTYRQSADSCAARFKRAKALKELHRDGEAQAEFRILVRDRGCPKEAVLAGQELR